MIERADTSTDKVKGGALAKAREVEVSPLPASGPVQKFRRYWSDASASVRQFSGWLVASSAVLFCVGAVGGLLDWWSDLPFLTNVVSSLATACAGVPLALILFQGIMRDQAIALSEQSTLKAAREVVAAIKSSCESALGEPLPEVIEASTVDELRLVRLLGELRSQPGSINSICERTHRALNILEEIQRVAPSPFEAHTRRRPAALTAMSELRYLNEHVRFRFKEAQLPWPGATWSANLDRLLLGLELIDFDWMPMVNAILDYQKSLFDQHSAHDEDGECSNRLFEEFIASMNEAAVNFARYARFLALAVHLSQAVLRVQEDRHDEGAALPFDWSGPSHLRGRRRARSTG